MDPVGDGVEAVGAGLEQHEHLVVVLDLALPHVDAPDRHRLGARDQPRIDEAPGDRLGLLPGSAGHLDLDVLAHGRQVRAAGPTAAPGSQPSSTCHAVAVNTRESPTAPTVTVAPASELVALPAEGRRHSATRPVRLGDVDPAGRLRLDAVARYLQDVANDDATDAGLPNAFGWVVRRTMLRVARAPVLGERCTATTFCSGVGRSWAERRTSIVGDAGGSVEAASLWVQIDPATGRPAALDESFTALYGAAAGGRRVSARLSLPAPPPESGGVSAGDGDGARVGDRSTIDRPWAVRQVDLDRLGHVNNAVAWSVLHELLGERATGPGTGVVEYVDGIDLADSPLALRSHVDDAGVVSAWLVAAGRVRLAARWAPN